MVGKGARLFKEGIGQVPLKLVASQAFSTGVLSLTYAAVLAHLVGVLAPSVELLSLARPAFAEPRPVVLLQHRTDDPWRLEQVLWQRRLRAC